MIVSKAQPRLGCSEWVVSTVPSATSGSSSRNHETGQPRHCVHPDPTVATKQSQTNRPKKKSWEMRLAVMMFTAYTEVLSGLSDT